MTHYGIIGPGAVGSLWAVKLGRGHRVSLWGRAGPQARSLVFVENRRPPEIFTFRLDERVPTVALITTKTYNTVAAIDGALARWGQDPAALVLFQNGVGCQEEVQTRFGHIPLLAVSTTEGANRREDETLVHAAAGLTRLGGLNGAGSSLSAKISTDFRAAGFETQVEVDIRAALWDKLAVNAGINAFTAILDCANGALAGHAFFEQHLPLLCHEIAQVSMASGYDANPRSIEARIRSVAASTADNISSMLQDVRAGRPTEIDAINGAIVSGGEAHDIPTPVNTMLVQAVKARAH